MLQRLIVMGVLLLIGQPLWAHETDQYTTPPGREYADLGEYMTAWVYDTLDRAVAKLNADIQADLAKGVSEAQILKDYDAQTVASAVFKTFPNAYEVIEGMERRVHSKQWKNRYPGRVVGHKAVVGHAYQFAHLPIDIRQFFKVWFASTIKVHGVYLGTDKLGHFTDMGHNYYKAYLKEIESGAAESQAVAAAVKLGTDDFFFSESGLLGNLTAGAYSNADLASNYAGFLFYKNLLQPVKLEGVERPALLVREGVKLRLAPHVGRSSDFFSWFISDHWDEALNPSLFDWTMRGGIRSAIHTRAPQILWRYRDEHGCTRSPAYFSQQQKDLVTYYAQDYGHKGTPKELILLSDACYEPVAADKNTSDKNPTGHSALHWAALTGDLDAARTLLARKVDADVPMRPEQAYSSFEAGMTPLHLAVHGGHEAIVRLLLESGASVDSTSAHGVTPLHKAGRWPSLAALLLQRGAAVNARDHAGRTPLHWAAMDSGAGVSALLEAGADITIADHAGQTPLHLAAKSGSLENVGLLVRGGAASQDRDSLGATPLHHAAQRGAVGAIQELLDAGAPVAATDAFGLTPLHVAAAHGQIPATLLLLQRGAPVDPHDSTGTTPLHLACRHGRRDVALILIHHHADVRTANRLGITPLHEAALGGDHAVYRTLVAEGADELAQNRAGRTPRQVASQTNTKPHLTGPYKRIPTAGGPTTPGRAMPGRHTGG